MGQRKNTLSKADNLPRRGCSLVKAPFSTFPAAAVFIFLPASAGTGIISADFFLRPPESSLLVTVPNLPGSLLPPLRITLEIIAVKILCQTPVILEHRISQPVGRLTVQTPNELLQPAVGFRIPVFQNFYLPAVFRPFFQDTQHTVQLNKPGKLRIFPFVPSDEGVN